MDALLSALSLLLTSPIAIAAVAGVVWGILGGALPGQAADLQAVRAPPQAGRLACAGLRLTRQPCRD